MQKQTKKQKKKQPSTYPLPKQEITRRQRAKSISITADIPNKVRSYSVNKANMPQNSLHFLRKIQKQAVKVNIEKIDEKQVIEESLSQNSCKSIQRTESKQKIRKQDCITTEKKQNIKESEDNKEQHQQTIQIKEDQIQLQPKQVEIPEKIATYEEIEETKPQPNVPLHMRPKDFVSDRIKKIHTVLMAIQFGGEQQTKKKNEFKEDSVQDQVILERPTVVKKRKRQMDRNLDI